MSTEQFGPLKLGEDEDGSLFGMALPYTDQKMADTLSTGTPDSSSDTGQDEVGPIRRASTGNSLFGSIDLQTFSLFNTELATALKRFRDEMYRTQFPLFIPAFKHKCTNCGQEYDTEVEECEVCGETSLRPPSQKKKRQWRKFFSRGNLNKAGQSLRDLMEYEEDFQSFYGVSVLVIKKHYTPKSKTVTTPDGSVVARKTGLEVKEVEAVQHGNPTRIIPITDEKGQPGGWWTCPQHRGEELKTKDELHFEHGECLTKCEDCNLPLKEVRFVETEDKSGSRRGKKSKNYSQYFFEGEVVQWARHFPLMQGLDGMSPVIPLVRQQAMLQFSRKYDLAFLDPENQDLPNKMLLIYTTNEEKLSAALTTEEEKTKANPIRTGQLVQEIQGSDDGSKMEVVDLTPEDLLGGQQAKLDNARKSIRAMFGTTGIMEDDDDSSGWDNTGVQLEVNDRGVANAHRDTIDKALDPLRRKIGMDEWKIEFVDPARDRDEMSNADIIKAIDKARGSNIPYKLEDGELSLDDHEFQPDQASEADQTADEPANEKEKPQNENS